MQKLYLEYNGVYPERAPELVRLWAGNLPSDTAWRIGYDPKTMRFMIEMEKTNAEALQRYGRITHAFGVFPSRVYLSPAPAPPDVTMTVVNTDEAYERARRKQDEVFDLTPYFRRF